MADAVVLAQSDYNQLYDVTSEVLMFKVDHPPNFRPTVKLFSHKILYEREERELFKVHLGVTLEINGLSQEISEIHLYDDFISRIYWLTWCGGKLCLGTADNPKALLSVKIGYDNIIRFVKFGEQNNNNSMVTWTIYKPPISLYTIHQLKHLKGTGDNLRWVRMTVNDHLPQDALIGGFEGEALYIIRAEHNNSLCPGKFLRHKKMASVPWGHHEHNKETFEVLCAFDVHWVSTEGNKIPRGAVVAGYSEIRREPLYIGRAVHENYLLVGKVHTLYSTCYLPFRGNEIESGAYEILVKGSSSDPRAMIID